MSDILFGNMTSTPKNSIANVASVVPQSVTFLTPVTATIATSQGLVQSQVYTVVSPVSSPTVTEDNQSQGLKSAKRKADVSITVNSKEPVKPKRQYVSAAATSTATSRVTQCAINPPAALKDYVVAADKPLKTSTPVKSGIPVKMSSTMIPATDETPKVKVVVDATKTPISLDSLAQTLQNFQAMVNQGIADITEKLTHPITGLETRVLNIEDTLNKDKTGLCDRVTDIEGTLATPTSGLCDRVSEVERKLQGTATVQASTAEIPDLADRLLKLESKVAQNESDLSIITAWADTMYKEHRSLLKQVLFNTSRSHANELLIGGIFEFKKQDCREAAMKFFKEKLKLTFKDKDVLAAKRIGGRKRLVIDDSTAPDGSGKRIIFCPRHMVVRCSPHFRNTVWENRTLLAGQTDPKGGYKFFIANYLPDAFKAANEKFRDELKRLQDENDKKPVNKRVSVRIVGTELHVGNQPKYYPVHPPTPLEVIQTAIKYGPWYNTIDFCVSKPLKMMGSTFHGYALRVQQVETIPLAYCKVRTLQPRARHIMCAYKVGTEEGSCDDEEYFGDLHMLKCLKKANLDNVVVFISRICGPKQLGKKRFQVIRTVMHEMSKLLAQRADVADAEWVYNKPADVVTDVQDRLREAGVVLDGDGPRAPTPENSDDEVEHMEH